MTEHFGCAGCAAKSCCHRNRDFPDFCPTTALDRDIRQQALDRYTENAADRQMARTSARIESGYYGRATRVEEMLLFIERMGYQKVGVATCVGLLKECRAFARVAQSRGIDLCVVGCKIGSVDKTDIGLEEADKLHPGRFEAMCNPILQAAVLNGENTDFNVIMGLCVGHDTLFIQHSQAPVSYLVVKDRVLCHNPAAVLYQIDGYYSKLLENE